MPKPLGPHVFHFPYPFSLMWALSRSRKGLSSSLHDLEVFSCFSMVGEVVIVMLSAYAGEIHVLVFSGGSFLSPSRFGSFSSISHAQNLFYVFLGGNGP